MLLGIHLFVKTHFGLDIHVFLTHAPIRGGQVTQLGETLQSLLVAAF